MKGGGKLIEYVVRLRTVKCFLFFAVLYTTVGMLAGCVNEKISKPNVGSNHNLPSIKETPGLSFVGQKVMPISELKGSFQTVVGWLTDDTILYITNENGGSNLYSYHLTTGESSLFYKSNDPIVSTMISPLREKILIHTALSSYQAKIIITDIKGNPLTETKIDSFELEAVWNYGSEEEVLLSAFKEDWSFTSYILNIRDNQLSEVDLPQPFVVWPAEDELVYLDWDIDRPSLHAPLVRRSLSSGTEETLITSVHHLDLSRVYILAISTESDDSAKAIYQIFNREYEQVLSFEVDHLSAFSGWLVPFYDMMDDEKKLIYFHPLRGGEADLYDEGFALTEYSFEDSKETTLFNQLENEPISCSPNGTLCLYGYQFEKIIDLKEKEIINLFLE